MSLDKTFMPAQGLKENDDQYDMIRWLSTSQMMDMLPEGSTAISKHYRWLIKKEGGAFIYVREGGKIDSSKGHEGYCILVDNFAAEKWAILPNRSGIKETIRLLYKGVMFLYGSPEDAKEAGEENARD